MGNEMAAAAKQSEEALSALKAEGLSTQEALKKQAEDGEALRAEVARLTEALAHSEKEKAESSTRLTQAGTEIAVLKEEAQNAAAQQVSETMRLEAALRESSEKASGLDKSLKAAVADLSSREKSWRQDFAKIKGELDTSNQNVASLTDSLSQASSNPRIWRGKSPKYWPSWPKKKRPCSKPEKKLEILVPSWMKRFQK